ncbi:MAG TPA: hypothetical protein VHA33_20085 [Candidatus Angelobacter sp.]|nr:hypothetical protein [Candidatus Angelobacter sp.]
MGMVAGWRSPRTVWLSDTVWWGRLVFPILRVLREGWGTPCNPNGEFTLNPYYF